MVMEYNRQVPFGGAIAAEAAKAKNQTVEMRDMGFATVTIAEKDGAGQQRSSNVCPLLPCSCLLLGLVNRFDKSFRKAIPLASCRIAINPC